MHDLHQGWGEQVRHERLMRCWSQRRLAELVGTNKATISRIEAGKLCPNDELKWKIAGAFGIRMDVLWAWPRLVPPSPTKVAA